MKKHTVVFGLILFFTLTSCNKCVKCEAFDQSGGFMEKETCGPNVESPENQKVELEAQLFTNVRCWRS
jgi:hypothetical protein